MNSYHLKRGGDGGAKAADIADRKKAWNASRRFWFIIGASCQARGIGWGGAFGLSRKQKAAFSQAVAILRLAEWPSTHPAYQCAIGFDPAHLQTQGNWD
jgi:hypothetical protein